jgi:uncharacterized protein YukE
LAQSDQPDFSADSEDVVSITSTDAGQMLADLRSLRQTIIVAWQERAVMLSSWEQKALRDKIKRTCELLTHLTSSSEVADDYPV